MRERRSERSRSSSGTSGRDGSRDVSPSHEPEGHRPVNTNAITGSYADDVSQSRDDDEGDTSRAAAAPLRPTVQPSRFRISERSHSRSRPTPGMAADPRPRNVTPPKRPMAPTPNNNNNTPPFPQIRGSRMERLFFSAPEHNARTCAVCHRRKRDGEMQRRVFKREEQDRDGDAETVKTYLHNQARRRKDNGERGRRDGSEGEDADVEDDDRLPPQTVLGRVVRELEDDFSHYKACVPHLD